MSKLPKLLQVKPSFHHSGLLWAVHLRRGRVSCLPGAITTPSTHKEKQKVRKEAAAEAQGKEEAGAFDLGKVGEVSRWRQLHPGHPAPRWVAQWSLLSVFTGPVSPPSISLLPPSLCSLTALANPLAIRLFLQQGEAGLRTLASP